jgi:hypothetical protein
MWALLEPSNKGHHDAFRSGTFQGPAEARRGTACSEVRREHVAVKQ